MNVNSRVCMTVVLGSAGMAISLLSSNASVPRAEQALLPKPLPVPWHMGERTLADLPLQPVLDRGQGVLTSATAHAPLFATAVGSHRLRFGSAEVTDRMNSAKHLLLDSRIIESVAGAELVVGNVVKHEGNPLFVIDKPWEVTVNNLYPNVLYSEPRELFQCWYLVYGSGRYDGLCYAQSRDGIAWEKPNLGLVEFKGSKNNNLIRRDGSHGVGVFLDHHETNPARRYKMFFNIIGPNSNHGPMGVCFSGDGIHWSDPLSCPEVEARGDTHNNAFWAPTQGKYVGITRTIRRVNGMPIRQVAWTTSKDFVRWTKCKVVLEGLEDHLQVYSMPVFHRGGVYLGLPAILDTKTRRVQTELAWSPDAMKWERLCPGIPLIPNAATNDGYDWGMVFAAVCPVFRKDNILLYYAGGKLPHRGKYDAGLCLATLRPDGHAGYETKGTDAVGFVTTKLIRCTGTCLRVTGDAEGGQIRISLFNDRNQRLSQSEFITANVTDAAVKWRGRADLSEYLDSRIQLRFELRNATIYAFSFGE